MRVIIVIALTALFIFGQVACGQSQTKDMTDLSLEDLMNVEVYSASKHMQSTSDAPSSVTVVTADEIEKYGYRTLADILESVRGFYITYDRDYSFVGVRGFGRLGDWNSRILVLVDGHRINDNILDQAYMGSEFLVDVDLIERVEIVRGPSSSLYGADAFFAVINVVTRKGPQLKGAEVSFADASFGTHEGRASYGGDYKGLDFMLSGTFYDSQGPLLFFPEFDSSATNHGITRDTDYENSQHMLATLSFHGFTLQGLFSARDKGVPTGYFGGLFNDPRTQNFDHHQYFDLSYQHELGEKWRLNGRTSYDQARLQAPVAYTAGPSSGSDTLDTYSFRGDWWDSEARVSRTFFRRHAVTFGTEIIDNLKQSQGDYTQLGNTFVTVSGSSTIWALYGQDEYSITSKLLLSAGIRYDHYSELGGTTNPRLGLIYHVAKPTTLKLLYGTAFRAPEPYETTPDYGAFYDNNPQLKPETIRTVEGIVEQVVGQHLTLSGSVFRNWIDNLISIETNPADGHSVYENAQQVNATGVEVELDGRWGNEAQGRASYSFTSTSEPLTHEVLPNSPRHSGKLEASIPVVKQRLFASMDAQYTSPAETLVRHTLSGFSVFNFTLLGHAMGKHLDISASAYNIFDKRYFNPGRPEDPEDAIQQDGRNYRIKVTTRF